MTGIIFAVYIIVKWVSFELKKELFLSVRPRIQRNLSTREKLDAIFTFTPLDVEITIENPTRIPLGPLEITDIAPPFELKSPNSFKINLGRNSKHLFNYTAIPKRSGAWVFTGIEVIVNDGRNYFRHQTLMPLMDRILIYPRMESAPPFKEGAAPGVRRQGASRSLVTLRMGGAFDGLREYQANDPYKMIEWKASSRALRLISKELETEHGSHVVFALDSSSSMLVGRHGEAKIDIAAKMVSTLAKVAIDKRDYVSLFIVGESLQQHIPAGKTLSHLYRILDTVSNTYYNSFRDMYRTASHYAVLQTVNDYLKEIGLIGRTFSSVDTKRVVEVLLEASYRTDNDITSVWSLLRKYAEDHNLPVSAELAFEPNRKNSLFVETLTHALSIVKDRAVFVILSDLEGLAPTDELMTTMKLIKRSHHQVFLLFFPSTKFEDVTVQLKKGSRTAKYAEKAKRLISSAYEQEKEYFVKQLEGTGIKVVTLTPSESSRDALVILAR